MMKKVMTQIFNIGLPRTGTNSMTEALRLITSERVKHEPSLDENFDWLNRATHFSGGIPWIFPEIDKRVEEAKFILSIRPLEDWLESIEWLCKRKAQKGGSRLLIEIFGTDGFSKSHFTTIFQRHQDYAQDYFKDRPDDFRIISIRDGMASLAEFIKGERGEWDGSPFPRIGKRIDIEGREEDEDG